MTTTRTIAIAAPPAAVWAVMSDVERWHEWTPTVTSVRLLDAGPLAVGTRARIVQPKLPTLVWRVTEVEPGRSFRWETRGFGGGAVAWHEVADDGRGGTVATLGIEQTGWLNALLARWIRPLTERYVTTEAEGLRRRSEAAARG
jgi:carbon monoxide dehydrogenase subunit G